MAKRILAIAFIFVCTSIAWVVLGATIFTRTQGSDQRLKGRVGSTWGTSQQQRAPVAFIEKIETRTVETPARRTPPGEPVPMSSTSGDRTETVRTRVPLALDQTRAGVVINLEHRRKGLLWYSTYKVAFDGQYVVKNPTQIPQTIYVEFKFPAADTRYDSFSLKFGENLSDKTPENGILRESVLLAPGAETPLAVTYAATGINQWTYSLKDAKRVKNLSLAMTTNFREINIPPGAESPSSRTFNGDAATLRWDYTDVIGANAIAMDMPAVTNPGYVAGRMTFFAPVSRMSWSNPLLCSRPPCQSRRRSGSTRSSVSP